MASASAPNTEQLLADAFPDSAFFIEKPVSTAPSTEAEGVARLLRARPTIIVSVGYMLRYSAAVQKIQQIIKENGLTVMMTSARYIMGQPELFPIRWQRRLKTGAYEHCKKLAWWNKSIDCGPIVEQGTHFVDLSRYLGGEIDQRSIMAHSLEWYEKPGKLSKVRMFIHTLAFLR